MANYDSLIRQIEAQIRENGENYISGPILQDILKQMVREINLTKADDGSVPTRLAQLLDDINHRTVTDTEKASWNAKSRAIWSALNNPHPSQELVDNRVTLTITNNNTPVGYTLALGNHTHPNIPTAEQIASWNAKSDFSGDYNDLTNKPDIIVKQQGGGKGNPIYIDNELKTQLVTYLATHPENSDNVLIPSLFSDISFLLARGGTCTPTARGWTYTDADKALMFDSAPSYFILNKNSVPSSPTMIVQIHLPETLYYSNYFYIDFGVAWWGAKKVRVQWGNGNYDNDLGTLDVKGSVFKCRFDASSGGVRDIQITLTEWEQYAEQSRIAEIGIVNFNGAGIRGTAMSRGIDDEVWRSITPAAANTYNLGSSQKPWANIFVQALAVLAGIVTPSITTPGNTLNFYKAASPDPILLASFNGSQLDIYSSGNRVLTINAYGIYPASGKSLGDTNSPWDAIALNGTIGILYGGEQFLVKWESDFVFNYANQTPTRRLLFYGALVQNLAHHFYTYINGVHTTLLTLGTENISYRDFRADVNTRKLGTSAVPWSEMHANRWFPKQGDDSIFVEFTNNRFVFNGNVIVTGYLGVGETGASTTDQYMQFSIFPAQTTLKLGNSTYKWAEIWCKKLFATESIGDANNLIPTIYAQNIGTEQKPVNHLYVEEISSAYAYCDGITSFIGSGTIPLSYIGLNNTILNDIRKGKVTIIEDSEAEKLYHITEVENTAQDETHTIIYFGRNLKLTQLSSTNCKIETV